MKINRRKCLKHFGWSFCRISFESRRIIVECVFWKPVAFTLWRRRNLSTLDFNPLPYSGFCRATLTEARGSHKGFLFPFVLPLFIANIASVAWVSKVSYTYRLCVMEYSYANKVEKSVGLGRSLPDELYRKVTDPFSLARSILAMHTAYFRYY